MWPISATVVEKCTRIGACGQPYYHCVYMDWQSFHSMSTYLFLTIIQIVLFSSFLSLFMFRPTWSPRCDSTGGASRTLSSTLKAGRKAGGGAGDTAIRLTARLLDVAGSSSSSSSTLFFRSSPPPFLAHWRWMNDNQTWCPRSHGISRRPMEWFRNFCTPISWRGSRTEFVFYIYIIIIIIIQLPRSSIITEVLPAVCFFRSGFNCKPSVT